MCVLILLHMCLQYCYIYVLILLYTYPLCGYVSSVLILVYVLGDTLYAAMCLASSYRYMC
jgi:hypothetical protein